MDSLEPPVGGDQNRGPELVAVIWVFTALASFVVSLRLFTRVKILKETALDDVFTILSLVSSRSWLYLSSSAGRISTQMVRYRFSFWYALLSLLPV